MQKMRLVVSDMFLIVKGALWRICFQHLANSEWDSDLTDLMSDASQYADYTVYTTDHVHYFTGPTEWRHSPMHLKSSALPVHLRPLPIQPGAQLHLKLPAVLVQVACLSQLWAPISHSLISGQEENK